MGQVQPLNRPEWRQCCPSSGATCPQGCWWRPWKHSTTNSKWFPTSFDWALLLSLASITSSCLLRRSRRMRTRSCRRRVGVKIIIKINWQSSSRSIGNHHCHQLTINQTIENQSINWRCLMSVFISPICSSSPVISVINCSRTFVLVVINDHLIVRVVIDDVDDVHPCHGLLLHLLNLIQVGFTRHLYNCHQNNFHWSECSFCKLPDKVLHHPGISNSFISLSS